MTRTEIQTAADAERYLDGLINRERRERFDYERFGLARVRALLDAARNPERALPCVHVAGSKGKGSVALMCEALLGASGLRVGTFTSPHLESWIERFRVDGAPVAEEHLVAALRALHPAIERQRADPDLAPSFFDVTTVLALCIFRSRRVDASVVEVGLGGRLDSTNACVPRVSVLTVVQLEHTDALGGTLEAIAREKAGILRPGVPLVHGPLDPGAFAAVMARAIAEDTPLDEADARLLEQTPHGLQVELDDGRRVRVGALGAQQARNAAIAIRASERFLGRSLHPGELAVLERLRLPARLERVGDAIVDVAHTPDSARALCETLSLHWPGRRWVFVVSISGDKDSAGIFQELAPIARACVLTRAEPTRSADPGALEPLAWAAGIERVEREPVPAAALERARALLEPADGIVVCGSMYLAGALRRHVCALEPGRE